MRNVLSELVKGNLSHIDDSRSGCSACSKWILEKTGPLKVIEIGTSYGLQLRTFVDLAESVFCIDPMYDWVPDVSENEGFKSELVDHKKLESWKSNAAPFGSKIELIIGSSFLVHTDPEVSKKLYGTELLIIDGCHHPAKDVAKDYTNFEKFLADEHYVIWDDMYIDDVKEATELVKQHLKASGASVSETELQGTLIMYIVRPHSVNGSTRPS